MENDNPEQNVALDISSWQRPLAYYFKTNFFPNILLEIKPYKKTVSLVVILQDPS